MKNGIFLVSLVVVFVSGSVYAQAAIENNKSDGGMILCRNQKVVRTIRIDKESKTNQCVTTYTKSGVDKEVGRAQNFGSCEKIAENIKANLETANWKCKEVDNATFSAAKENQ